MTSSSLDEITKLDNATQIIVLKTANRIARLLSKTQYIEKIIENLMKEFLELSQADEGSIQLIRPTSEATRLTLIRKGKKDKGQLDSRLDDMLTGRTVIHKQAYLTHTLVSDLSLGTTAVKRYAAISSVLSIPVKTPDHVIGVVNLLRLRKSQLFTEMDKELLVALTSEIAEFIDQAQLREQLFSNYERLMQEVEDRYAIHGIIGRSPAMNEVFNVLERVIPTDGRVMLQGESGTGKELIAKIIHYEGPRKDGPFIAVDCGALPANLLESELFGYMRGAFTGANRDRKGLFEEANGGTLFLDEITNTNLEMQAKLLRVLQEGEVRPLGSNHSRKVDVRIITAASSDLQKKVSTEEFRSDLFYRLNVVPIRLPALRERIEDISVLASHFLKRFSENHKKELCQIATPAIQILERHPWPGNVRELENVMERAVIMADIDDRTLLPEHLPYELSFADTHHPVFELPNSGDLTSLLANYEREILLKVLHHHGGNKSAAARALNISERVIRYKMKRLRLLTE